MPSTRFDHRLADSARKAIEHRLEDGRPTICDVAATMGTRPRTLHAYVEWRERGMVAYLDELPAGTWEMTYPLRAETPGRFHALPATLEAFYLPTWQGNSAETRLRVTTE